MPNPTSVLPLGRRRAEETANAKLSRAGRHSQTFRAWLPATSNSTARESPTGSWRCARVPVGRPAASSREKR